MKDGRSGYFVQQNRGKLSLCLDARTPAGKAILSDLIKKVDILVENFAPGVIARMGFDYNSVRKLNPKIIMCSVSTFGQEGPLANDPGYDFIGQAYAGITDQIGEPDRAPSQLTMAAGDISTGVAAAMGVGFALLHRERTGEGQYLDASITDTYFHWHHEFLPKVSLRGPAAVPKRNGSQHPYGSPSGVFKCPGGYIMLLVQQHEFPLIAKAG